MPNTRIGTLGKRAPDGAYEIPILGEIGAFGVNGEDLIRELRMVKPKEVRFIIYSGGGAVYDAIAVAGWIKDQGIICYAEIYGICMSAATVFAALAGPKNTSIAPGSMMLIHMPYGGDQKAIDNAVDYMVDLYVSAYGWSKSEAKGHMTANDGEGELWTVAEVKKLGLGEAMESAKIAAHFNIELTTNKMTTDKAKTTVNVKLTTLEAIRAAVGEGVNVEVEIEEATAATIATMEAKVSELTAEIETLKAAQVAPEVVEAATAEVVATAVTEATANAAKATADEVAKVTAAYEEKIAALKAPVDKPTIANNTVPVEGAVAPVLNQGQQIVQAALKAAKKNVNPLQRAQAEMQAKG